VAGTADEGRERRGSGVILYGDFGAGGRVLLTGDAGINGLTWAGNYAAVRRGPSSLARRIMKPVALAPVTEPVNQAHDKADEDDHANAYPVWTRGPGCCDHAANPPMKRRAASMFRVVRPMASEICGRMASPYALMHSRDVPGDSPSSTRKWHAMPPCH
jgi:hypothetical protein